jgi:hypothetical protein
MASHKEIVPFFYKWEGGLSKDKNVAVGFMPVHVARVLNTDTTATDIIANW